MANTPLKVITLRPVDLDCDEIVPLYGLKKEWPGPVKPSKSTAWRYTTEGLRVRGRDEIVKLPSVVISGIKCTSVECIKLFLNAVNGLGAVPTVSKTQRRKMAEAHNQLCAAQGY